MEDLSVIDGGDSVTVSLKGQQYVFGALTVGQLPAFARAVKPMSGAIGPLLSGGITLESVLGLVADHGDSVIEAIAIATKIPRSVIESCSPAEMLEVVPLMLAVNKDFLLRRLSPALQAAARSITSPGAGQTPSQS